MQNSNSFLQFFENILTHWIFRLLVPFILFSYIFIKYFGKKLNRIYFCTVIINFWVVTSFFFLKENYIFDEMEKTNLIKTILPRISYFLAFFALLIHFFFPNESLTLSKEGKFMLILLPIGISSLMIIGKNSHIICLCLFSIVYNYIKTIKCLNIYDNIQTAAYLSSLSYYFWYAFGNKPQIAALQVNNVYIGFETFNFYISGTMLIVNCGASFLLLIFLLPVADVLYRKGEFVLYEFERNNNVKKMTYIKNLIVFSLYFLVTITCTSLNCIVQRRALLLIEDFAPKFFFDGAIFVFSNAILLIILVIFAI